MATKNTHSTEDRRVFREYYGEANSKMETIASSEELKDVHPDDLDRRWDQLKVVIDGLQVVKNTKPKKLTFIQAQKIVKNLSDISQTHGLNATDMRIYVDAQTATKPKA